MPSACSTAPGSPPSSSPTRRASRGESFASRSSRRRIVTSPTASRRGGRGVAPFSLRPRRHRHRPGGRTDASGRHRAGRRCGQPDGRGRGDPATGMKGSSEGGRLLALVDALAGRRVVIAGDLIADEFIYGEIARVSREAPVLILNYDSTEVVPGGAGNAAGNVAALGGAARLAGVTGRDETGRRLLGTLRSHKIDVGAILRPAGYRTPTKTRILAGAIPSANQHAVGIDRAASAPIDAKTRGGLQSP